MGVGIVDYYFAQTNKFVLVFVHFYIMPIFLEQRIRNYDREKKIYIRKSLNIPFIVGKRFKIKTWKGFLMLSKR